MLPTASEIGRVPTCLVEPEPSTQAMRSFSTRRAAAVTSALVLGCDSGEPFWSSHGWRSGTWLAERDPPRPRAQWCVRRPSWPSLGVERWVRRRNGGRRAESVGHYHRRFLHDKGENEGRHVPTLFQSTLSIGHFNTARRALRKRAVRGARAGEQAVAADASSYTLNAFVCVPCGNPSGA